MERWVQGNQNEQFGDNEASRYGCCRFAAVRQELVCVQSRCWLEERPIKPWFLPATLLPDIPFTGFSLVFVYKSLFLLNGSWILTLVFQPQLPITWQPLFKAQLGITSRALALSQFWGRLSLYLCSYFYLEGHLFKWKYRNIQHEWASPIAQLKNPSATRDPYYIPGWERSNTGKQDRLLTQYSGLVGPVKNPLRNDHDPVKKGQHPAPGPENHGLFIVTESERLSDFHFQHEYIAIG